MKNQKLDGFHIVENIILSRYSKKKRFMRCMLFYKQLFLWNFTCMQTEIATLGWNNACFCAYELKISKSKLLVLKVSNEKFEASTQGYIFTTL